jgi:hypothetical protein
VDLAFVIRQIHPPFKSARATDATTVALVVEGVVVGNYLEWSDPDANFGRGDDRWTRERAKAKRFPTVKAAMDCWKARSKLIPTRPDGQPNRPMTAYSITVEEIPDER